MNENSENKEEITGHDLEPNTKLHTLLHTKQHSRYSLCQHLLYPICFLTLYLFIGFYESYEIITQMLARSTLILYLLVIIITYLITKKRDVLYMIVAFIIEFPILVFLAYFDQMIALLTLSFIGLLPWVRFRLSISHSSSLKVSKKISLKNKS